SVCDDNGNCLTVLTATPANGTNVVLTTFDPMTEGSNYTATIVGGPIYDKCGNPTVNPANGANFVEIGSSANFRAWVFLPCLMTFKTFEGPGKNIDNFVASANYPNNPRVLENGKKVAYIAGFDSRLFYGDDSHEQYNGQMQGFVVPPVTGDYIFYLLSDDPGRLYMNTNNAIGSNSEDPAGAVNIVEETGCCNNFSAHSSATITLNAGQR